MPTSANPLIVPAIAPVVLASHVRYNLVHPLCREWHRTPRRRVGANAPMEYRQLGRSGLRVSVIGLGGNTFGRYADEERTAPIIGQALDVGINFIDTADVYGNGVSEELLGKAIHGHRDELLIATKVGMRMRRPPQRAAASSRKHIIEGCHASLRRLAIETIDLYQIHAFDAETPLEETLGALDDLVRAGKVRYIGCSNYPAWRIAQALWVSDREHLATLHLRAARVQPVATRGGARVGAVLPGVGRGDHPVLPVGGGRADRQIPAGCAPPEGTRGHNNPRFARAWTARRWKRVQRLDAWARERDHSVGELALAWLAARPGVSDGHRGHDAPGAGGGQRPRGRVASQRRRPAADRRHSGGLELLQTGEVKVE